MTVHLAVTSGIPLPVCGETLQGSFTFSHRFSKMAHLRSVRPSVDLSFGRRLRNIPLVRLRHSRFSSGWSTPVKVTARSTPWLISSVSLRVRRPCRLGHAYSLFARHAAREFYRRIDRTYPRLWTTEYMSTDTLYRTNRFETQVPDTSSLHKP